MALYLVGDYIREVRLRKGYTQEAVCCGICTSASLSRIESGTQTPSRCRLDKILERLGTENNIFTTFASKEEMEIYETIQTMTRNIADGDMDKLEIQIARLEQMTKNSEELEKQYLIFAKAELMKKRGGEYEKIKELLMKAIHLTLPSFNGKTPLYNNLLTFDEIVIINSIAVLYEENGNVIEALKLVFWLKEYMEDKLMDCRLKIAKYPVIIYDLSTWLGKMERYGEVLKLAEQGIEFCIKYGNMFVFPYLIFNKAYALAKLDERNMAKKFFVQSTTIFEAMGKDDIAKITADWSEKL